MLSTSRPWAAIALLVAATASPTAAAHGTGAGRPRQETAGTVAGRVVDADTGAPLDGVLVRAQPVAPDAPAYRRAEAHSDTDGRFRIGELPTGRYELFVSLVGYGLARRDVEVASSEPIELVVPLAAGTGTYTEQVTVTADSATRPDVLIPTVRSLQNAQLQELRGVLADDPLRAVQTLPGVATGDDFRAEFSVRGSSFDHVGVAVDGVSSGWLVHTVERRGDTGSIAMVNSEVLGSIALAAASYPQRHAPRTGAWLDLSLREGSRDARVLRGAVSGTNASLVGEGPLGHARRGSWIASIRQSYLHWLLQRLDVENDTAFGFTDAQGKAAFDLTPAQRIELTVVGGRSKLDEQDTTPGANSIDTGAHAAALVVTAWRVAPGPDWLVTQRAAFVGRRYRNTGAFDQELEGGSGREWQYRADAWHALRPGVGLEVGGEWRHVHEAQRARVWTRRSATDPPELAGATERSATYDTQGAYAIATVSLGALSLAPGARVDRSTYANDTLASPWLQGQWRVGRAVVSGGAGVYRQFAAFEQAPGSGRPPLGAERARHADLGVSHPLWRGLDWQVTAYDRQEHEGLRLENSETRLVNGRIVVPVPGMAHWANALATSARGVEVVLSRSGTRGPTGWIGYSYGRTRVDDTITGERYPGDYDQRHALNAYARYRFTARTSISGRFRTGTNVPLGAYVEERASALFVSEQRNLARLPTYARLDLRADRTFNFDRRRLTVFAEVINVLDRKNLGPADGAFRVRTGEAVGFTETLLPILPSAGLLVEF